jgi:hypothetical protein
MKKLIYKIGLARLGAKLLSLLWTGNFDVTPKLLLLQLASTAMPPSDVEIAYETRVAVFVLRMLYVWTFQDIADKLDL